MRVQIVDPPAYTPPYDRSLCAALARAGAEVELLTSPFAHGSVPAPEGYRALEPFYSGTGAARRARRAASHLTGMLRHRRASEADLVHYQWLTFPRLDRFLLSPRHPRLFTAHGWLREGAWSDQPGRGLRGLFESMDAIVVLSEWGASRLRTAAAIPSERVKVIPHGAFDYLTRIPDPAPLLPELAGADRPVVLCFGLIRPYKGVDVLLEAFQQVEGAELWVVGRPLGVDLDRLRNLAERARGRVRLVPRFVDDRQLPAIFERADLVVLPHRDVEQSGVLFAALAFGKPIVMSAVGGFPEVAAQGAGCLVAPGDPEALAEALNELLASPAERERLAAGARAAAAGPYAWDSIAERHLALYRELLDR